jgi:hypothetical protein
MMITGCSRSRRGVSTKERTVTVQVGATTVHVAVMLPLERPVLARASAT